MAVGARKQFLDKICFSAQRKKCQNLVGASFERLKKERTQKFSLVVLGMTTNAAHKIRIAETQSRIARHSIG